jgi:hypothetical protein
MKFSPEILEELNSVSPLLADIGNANIFSVPEGYFNTVTVEVIKKVNAAPENKLAVPEGYFENLSNQILNKIKSLDHHPEQELKTLSPLLYSIQNENVFTVPAGYFNNLSHDILEKVAPSQAKVISIRRRDPVWKMAAAAVVTGIIAVSSLMVFNRSQSTTNNEIPVSAYIQEASRFKNENQIDAGVASLSDDEIIKYLEKTGNDADNEVLARNINERALPDQKDYLLDDKTLDSYLNNIEKSSKN